VLQIVDTAHIFVTLLCRNGARYECLDFISSIAKGNQKRVQQGISSQLEFFSTMSVSMEAFALRKTQHMSTFVSFIHIFPIIT
jgi:hypothetical protein